MVALCAVGWIAGLSGSTAATFTSFEVPGATNPAGWRINARGDVVGDCDYYEFSEGFVRWADGTFTVFGMNTYATGINDDGVVVGIAISGRHDYGFIREADGTSSQIVVPGAYTTDPRDVNASGVVVGEYDGKEEGGPYGFIRTPDGQIQTFAVPGSEQTFVAGINASGDIAGSYGYPEGVLSGFLRAADGTFTTFEVPGATGGTWVRGINDRGLIIGDYVDGNGTHGFERAANGTLTTIDVPNGVGATVAVAISAMDKIVGWYGTGSAISGFTLSHHGKIGAIRVPKGHDDAIGPYAININGDITGGYWDANGEHGFIRSP